MNDRFTKLDAMDKKIGKVLKKLKHKEQHVIYFAYDTEDNDDPVDNLDEVAIEGKCILVSYADKFWGGKDSKDYYSKIITNPTWMEVAICANEMITVTHDYHHVFLEGLTEEGEERNGVPIYEFVMGS